MLGWVAEPPTTGPAALFWRLPRGRSWGSGYQRRRGLGPTPAGFASVLYVGVCWAGRYCSLMSALLHSINTGARDSGICRGGADSRRMCGIVAMLLADKAAVVNQCLYDALTSLQHRGQDAAGKFGFGLGAGGACSDHRRRPLVSSAAHAPITPLFRHRDGGPAPAAAPAQGQRPRA